MAQNYGENVTVQGNFFDHRNVKFAEALNDSLLDIGALGSDDVKRQLTKGHGFRTGVLKGRVGFGLVKNLHMQIDAGALHFGRNIIYAAWVEGVSSLNKRSRFKGYFMFKKTADYLRKQPKEVQEIMKYHIEKALN